MSRVFRVTESKMEKEDEHDELCIESAVVVAVVARKKRRRPRTCWVRHTANGYLVDHNLGHILLQ